jgi:hypothetical protein
MVGRSHRSLTPNKRWVVRPARGVPALRVGRCLVNSYDIVRQSVPKVNNYCCETSPMGAPAVPPERAHVRRLATLPQVSDQSREPSRKPALCDLGQTCTAQGGRGLSGPLWGVPVGSAN